MLACLDNQLLVVTHSNTWPENELPLRHILPGLCRSWCALLRGWRHQGLLYNV